MPDPQALPHPRVPGEQHRTGGSARQRPREGTRAGSADDEAPEQDELVHEPPRQHRAEEGDDEVIGDRTRHAAVGPEGAGGQRQIRHEDEVVVERLSLIHI